VLLQCTNGAPIISHWIAPKYQSVAPQAIITPERHSA